MKKYLEYKDGASAKFYEIILEGIRVNIRYGKIGTAGVQKNSEYADSKTAEAEFQKKLNSKLKKGYVEIPEKETADIEIYDENTKKRVQEILLHLEALKSVPGKRAKVQVMDTNFDLSVEGINRGGGIPIGMDPAKWPLCEPDSEYEEDWDENDTDYRMAHLMTLDLSHIDVDYVLPISGVLHLFVPNLMEGFHYDDPVEHVYSSHEEFEKYKDHEYRPVRDNRFSSEQGIRLLPPINIPLIVFIEQDFPASYDDYTDSYREDQAIMKDMNSEEKKAYLANESPLKEIYFAFEQDYKLSEQEYNAVNKISSLFGSLPFIGGGHITIQESYGQIKDYDKELYIQFGQEIAGLNLGDRGLLYLSGDEKGFYSYWDCC